MYPVSKLHRKSRQLHQLQLGSDTEDPMLSMVVEHVTTWLTANVCPSLHQHHAAGEHYPEGEKQFKAFDR